MMRKHNRLSDYQREKKHQQTEETKLFIFYTAVLFIIVCILSVMARKYTYAATNEVIIADIPSNIGGQDDYIESSVVTIIDDGSGETLQAEAPNIIYVDRTSDRSGNAFANAGNKSDNDRTDISDNANGQSDGSLSESLRLSKLRQSSESSVQGESESGVNDIYIADSDDDCPVSDAVPLPIEVQEYIWTHCKRVTGDYKNYYAFILGAIQHESSFKRTAIHHNKNGTTDRGLMQINSCNIKECKNAGLISCTDDLWDIYKNIDCGFHEMNSYVEKHGVSESAYYAYNTGREKGGSNKNSRIVMKYMAQWNAILFG